MNKFFTEEKEHVTNFLFDENGYDQMGRPKKQFNASLYFESEDENMQMVEDKDPQGVSVGDIIFHKTLGEAEVISVSGDGENKYIKLLFFSNNVKREFPIKSFDNFLSFKPFESNLQAEDSYEDKVYEQETHALNWTLEHIDQKLKPKLEKELRKKYNKLFEDSLVTDTSSGVAKKTGRDYRKMEEFEFHTTYSNMKENPYFARFAFNNEDLYISKSGVEADNIIDWHNPKCQYYYQYDKHFANKEIELKLVRDLSIAHGKLFEYIDKFNFEKNERESDLVVDNYINKVIKQNRKNKAVHDIVSSIKRNQYEIMTSNFDRNVMVLGCAGSGKTMILIHRISYILFNSEKLNANNIFIVSPTEYLKTENSILSELPSLKLHDANKVTVHELFKDQLLSYFKTLDSEYLIDENIIQTNINMSKPEIYSQKYLDKKVELFNKIMAENSFEKIDFVVNYKSAIKRALDSINIFDEEKRLKIHEVYRNFIDECKNYSLENIDEMENNIDNELSQKRDIEAIKKVIEAFSKYGYFNAPTLNESANRSEEFKKQVNSVDGVSIIIARCNVLKKLYTNLEYLNIDKFDAVKHKDILDYFINNLSSNDISVDDDLRTKIYEFVTTRSNLFVQTIIEAINNKLNVFKNLEDFKVIVKIIGKSRYFGDEKNIHPKQFRNFLAPVKEIFELFDYNLHTKSFNEKLKVIETIDNPLSYLDLYYRLIKEQKKIADFDAGKNVDILFNVLSFVVNEKHLLDVDKKIKFDWQVFVALYILNNLVGNEYYGEKRYVFIDEFQDLSLTEIGLIKDLFPGAVINLYGDFKQCISKKGIRNELEIKEMFPSIATYYINENYRNAFEITKYINKSLNMKMEPIGLNGVVTKLEPDLSNFKIKKNDRIVYIVKDKEHANYHFMNKLGIIEGWKNEQENKIKNEQPIALTVQDVKGLEFEIVIVDDKDMTYNEKYVACTRALEKLYFV